MHLTQASGKVFVEAILEASDKCFKADYVDLGKDEPHTTEAPGPELSLEARMSCLENEVEERRWYDNLLFARTREELDTTSNKSKEDRIVMTGLTSNVPPPREWAAKKEWIQDLVIVTLKKVLPEFSGKLGFINQGKNNGS